MEYCQFTVSKDVEHTTVVYSSDRSSGGGHLVGLLLLGLAPDFRISFLLGFIFF